MKKYVFKDRVIEDSYKAGDRVQVTKYVKLGDESKYEIIKGMCLRRKDNMLESHFTLLNNKDETTFEMKVPVFSPWVKHVKILERGKIKAKSIPWMRDRPIEEFQT